MITMNLPTIFLILLTISCATCLKILVMMTVPSASHHHIFKPLVEVLSARNHQVTFITPYNLSTRTSNLEYVSVAYKSQFMPLNKTTETPMFSFSDITMAYGKRTTNNLVSKLGSMIGLFITSRSTCGHFLHSPALYQFASQNRSFDLIITGASHTNCLLGFVQKYNASLVLFSPSLIPIWYYSGMGLPSDPAYIPNVFSGFTTKMSFLERVQNTILNVVYKFYFAKVQEPENIELAKKFFGQDLKEPHLLVEQASLLLVNSHFSLMGARPQVPGVIEVGGIHIGKVNKLPENIEKWINESTEDVIYFSMGSIIKGHTFPEEKRKIFLKAFGRLKQRVLWKWENETMPDKPDNVMIQKWMPQFDILCHPNVKAFIAHGGLLGTTEAVHCGVPVIMLPQFGDQHTNARALEAGGGGVVLDFWQSDEEMVYNALKTVLDPQFNRKAKELSARFRDRPMSPMDTAIYWIEYVARHKGAHHMRTAAVGMPLYQYLLLDVFGLLALCVLTVLFVGIYVTKFVCRTLTRRLFQERDKKKKVEKN